MRLIQIPLIDIHQEKELKQLGFVRKRPNLYNYKKTSVYVNGELSNIEIVTKIVNWKRYITGVQINGQDVCGLNVLRYEE